MSKEAKEESEKDSKIDAEFLEMMEQAVILGRIREDNPDKIDLNQEELGVLAGKVTLAKLQYELEKEIYLVEKEVKELSDSDELTDVLERRLEARKIQESSDKFIKHITLCSIFLEHYSIQLLEKEVISQEYKDSSKTRKFLEHNLNQEEREDLLLRAGIIEESLKSEMSHVRILRNRIVHEFTNFLFLDGVDNVVSEAQRAYQACNDLGERIVDTEGITLEFEGNFEDDE